MIKKSISVTHPTKPDRVTLRFWIEDLQESLSLIQGNLARFKHIVKAHDRDKPLYQLLIACGKTDFKLKNNTGYTISISPPEGSQAPDPIRFEFMLENKTFSLKTSSGEPLFADFPSGRSEIFTKPGTDFVKIDLTDVRTIQLACNENEKYVVKSIPKPIQHPTLEMAPKFKQLLKLLRPVTAPPTKRPPLLADSLFCDEDSLNRFKLCVTLFSEQEPKMTIQEKSSQSQTLLKGFFNLATDIHSFLSNQLDMFSTQPDITLSIFEKDTKTRALAKHNTNLHRFLQYFDQITALFLTLNPDA
ncbi:MAG: hypothetical protein ACI9BD_001372 [Candidatus Marinamargulisbacteria bacterium]|jgi:hypothetical protein